ncbi:MAG: hypothetical protein K2M31_02775 [Muribaculaceae bacterium]|nr:hypothetical protein [Muribaculaceae bacterium]
MKRAVRICGIFGIVIGMLALSACDLSQHKEKKKKKRHSDSEMVVDSRSSTKPLSKKQSKEVSASSGKSGSGRKIRVFSSSANYSHLERQGNCTYSPRNLTDGDKSTAFIIPTPGYTPLRLTFKLDGSRVRKIRIRNGYQKTTRTFNDHGRVGYINVYAYDGNEYVAQLYAGDTYDINGIEEFDLPRTSGYYNRIVLEFPSDELITGDKFDELAISEVEFYR